MPQARYPIIVFQLDRARFRLDRSAATRRVSGYQTLLRNQIFFLNLYYYLSQNQSRTVQTECVHLNQIVTIAR